MIGRQFLMFGAVGVLNTALGLGIIFLLQLGFGLQPLIANALGYTAGIVSSIVLNGKVTFRVSVLSGKILAGFCLVYAIAYGANALCVWMLQNGHAIFGQLCGVVVYTTLCFAGCRLVASRSPRVKQEA